MMPTSAPKSDVTDDAGSTEQEQVAGAKDALESLRARYDDVKRRIAAAAQRSGRSADSIMLVAVTKNAAIDQIRQLIQMGHQDFGENRVQNLQKRMAVVDEFLRRHRELSGDRRVELPDRVRWHMIGHLQRNKVRKVIGKVRLIQSVDSMRLIEEIHAITARLEEPIEILIQVNIAGEKQKHGFAPPAVAHVVEQVDTMLGLRVRGLMCMAPYSDNPEDSRSVFERAGEMFADFQREGVGGERFDILSLGMSGDFEVAIECGANLVRVGSAIFGDQASKADAETDGEGGDEDE